MSYTEYSTVRYMYYMYLYVQIERWCAPFRQLDSRTYKIHLHSNHAAHSCQYINSILFISIPSLQNMHINIFIYVHMYVTHIRSPLHRVYNVHIGPILFTWRLLYVLHERNVCRNWISPPLTLTHVCDIVCSELDIDAACTIFMF